jgi:hypothetical protein
MANLVEGTLKLSLRRPATVLYRMQPDGTLDATYEWAGGISRATLTRVQGIALQRARG